MAGLDPIQMMIECKKEETAARAALYSEVSDIKIHLTKIDSHLESTNKLFADYNKLLQEHIQRTELLEARTDKLETPGEVLAYILTAIKWIGIPIGTVYAVVKVIMLFKDKDIGFNM